MERAREVSRSGGARATRRGRRRACTSSHEDVLRFARDAGFRTRFVGYETTEADTVLRVAERANGVGARQARGVALLPGGRRPGVRQRGGRDARRARARGRRLPPRRRPGAGARAARGRARPGRVGARRSWSAPSGSPRCATTPPPICCTRRCASGSAPTCARPAPTWAPTSCASTSRTASGSPTTSWRDVEQRVSELGRGQPRRARDRDHARRGRARSARWRCSARSTATGCGWSRSTPCRASCAAARTWPRTGELGLFHLTHETSSASNVRRIEAVTGPVERRAVPRAHRAPARAGARCCGCPRTRSCARSSASPSGSRSWRRAGASARPRRRRAARGAAPDERRRRARGRRGRRARPDAKALLALSDAVRQKLGEAVVVLGTAVDGRVHLVANVAPGAVERGVKAGDVVRAAAAGGRRRRRRARHDGPGRRARSREAARGARHRGARRSRSQAARSERSR